MSTTTTLAPPPPRGRDQAVWVGLFLVLGLVATLGALLVFTDAAIFRGRYIVTTRVPDAGGIRRGDPVQMRGVNIGRVQGFDISRDGVAIRLEIEGEYAVPSDSRVELRSAGLLGGLVADIVPGSASTRLRYGDTLPGHSAEPLTDATNKIATQVETVAQRMEELLSPDTIRNVRDGSSDLRHALEQVSGMLDEQRGEIKALVASLRRSSSGLERAAAGPELERTVKRLDDLTRRMEGITASLEASSRSVESVLGRVDRGEGTLGRLSRDAALYDNLTSATLRLDRAAQDFQGLTQDLRELARDVRKNPRRYLKFSVF